MSICRWLRICVRLSEWILLNFPLSHGSNWASSTFRHQQGRWFFPDLQILLNFLDGGSLAQPRSQVVSGSIATQICCFLEGGSFSSSGCLPRWFPGWERREARGPESISLSDTEPFSWCLLLITSVQKEECFPFTDEDTDAQRRDLFSEHVREPRLNPRHFDTHPCSLYTPLCLSKCGGNLQLCPLKSLYCSVL